MDDPVFGQLRYDRELKAWQGQSKLKITGEQTALAIHSDGPPPTDNQQEIYRELCARYDDLKPLIAKALFRYYRWNRRFIFSIIRMVMWICYGERNIDAHYKHAKRSDEIWDLLSLPSIEIPIDSPEGQVVAFLFECDWDEEHGMIVVLTDWRITHCSIQG